MFKQLYLLELCVLRARFRNMLINGEVRVRVSATILRQDALDEARLAKAEKYSSGIAKTPGFARMKREIRLLRRHWTYWREPYL